MNTTGSASVNNNSSTKNKVTPISSPSTSGNQNSAQLKKNPTQSSSNSKTHPIQPLSVHKDIDINAAIQYLTMSFEAIFRFRSDSERSGLTHELCAGYEPGMPLEQYSPQHVSHAMYHWGLTEQIEQHDAVLQHKRTICKLFSALYDAISSNNTQSIQNCSTQIITYFKQCINSPNISDNPLDILAYRTIKLYALYFFTDNIRLHIPGQNNCTGSIKISDSVGYLTTHKHSLYATLSHLENLTQSSNLDINDPSWGSAMQTLQRACVSTRYLHGKYIDSTDALAQATEGNGSLFEMRNLISTIPPIALEAHQYPYTAKIAFENIQKILHNDKSPNQSESISLDVWQTDPFAVAWNSAIQNPKVIHTTPPKSSLQDICKALDLLSQPSNLNTNKHQLKKTISNILKAIEALTLSINTYQNSIIDHRDYTACLAILRIFNTKIFTANTQQILRKRSVYREESNTSPDQSFVELKDQIVKSLKDIRSNIALDATLEKSDNANTLLNENQKETLQNLQKFAQEAKDILSPIHSKPSDRHLLAAYKNLSEFGGNRLCDQLFTARQQNIATNFITSGSAITAAYALSGVSTAVQSISPNTTPFLTQIGASYFPYIPITLIGMNIAHSIYKSYMDTPLGKNIAQSLNSLSSITQFRQFLRDWIHSYTNSSSKEVTVQKDEEIRSVIKYLIGSLTPKCMHKSLTNMGSNFLGLSPVKYEISTSERNQAILYKITSVTPPQDRGWYNSAVNFAAAHPTACNVAKFSALAAISIPAMMWTYNQIPSLTATTPVKDTDSSAAQDPTPPPVENDPSTPSQSTEMQAIGTALQISAGIAAGGLATYYMKDHWDSIGCIAGGAALSLLCQNTVPMAQFAGSTLMHAGMRSAIQKISAQSQNSSSASTSSDLSHFFNTALAFSPIVISANLLNNGWLASGITFIGASFLPNILSMGAQHISLSTEMLRNTNLQIASQTLGIPMQTYVGGVNGLCTSSSGDEEENLDIYEKAKTLYNRCVNFCKKGIEFSKNAPVLSKNLSFDSTKKTLTIQQPNDKNISINLSDTSQTVNLADLNKPTNNNTKLSINSLLPSSLASMSYAVSLAGNVSAMVSNIMDNGEFITFIWGICTNNQVNMLDSALILERKSIQRTNAITQHTNPQQPPVQQLPAQQLPAQQPPVNSTLYNAARVTAMASAYACNGIGAAFSAFNIITMASQALQELSPLGKYSWNALRSAPVISSVLDKMGEYLPVPEYIADCGTSTDMTVLTEDSSWSVIQDILHSVQTRDVRNVIKQFSKLAKKNSGISGCLCIAIYMFYPSFFLIAGTHQILYNLNNISIGNIFSSLLSGTTNTANKSWHTIQAAIQWLRTDRFASGITVLLTQYAESLDINYDDAKKMQTIMGITDQNINPHHLLHNLRQRLLLVQKVSALNISNHTDISTLFLSITNLITCAYNVAKIINENKHKQGFIDFYPGVLKLLNVIHEFYPLLRIPSNDLHSCTAFVMLSRKICTEMESVYLLNAETIQATYLQHCYKHYSIQKNTPDPQQDNATHVNNECNLIRDKILSSHDTQIKIQNILSLTTAIQNHTSALSNIIYDPLSKAFDRCAPNAYKDYKETFASEDDGFITKNICKLSNLYCRTIKWCKSLSNSDMRAQKYKQMLLETLQFVKLSMPDQTHTSDDIMAEWITRQKKRITTYQKSCDDTNTLITDLLQSSTLLNHKTSIDLKSLQNYITTYKNHLQSLHIIFKDLQILLHNSNDKKTPTNNPLPSSNTTAPSPSANTSSSPSATAPSPNPTATSSTLPKEIITSFDDPALNMVLDSKISLKFTERFTDCYQRIDTNIRKEQAIIREDALSLQLYYKNDASNNLYDHLCISANNQNLYTSLHTRLNALAHEIPIQNSLTSQNKPCLLHTYAAALQNPTLMPDKYLTASYINIKHVLGIIQNIILQLQDNSASYLPLLRFVDSTLHKWIERCLSEDDYLHNSTCLEDLEKIITQFTAQLIQNDSQYITDDKLFGNIVLLTEVLSTSYALIQTSLSPNNPLKNSDNIPGFIIKSINKIYSQKKCHILANLRDITIQKSQSPVLPANNTTALTTSESTQQNANNSNTELATLTHIILRSRNIIKHQQQCQEVAKLNMPSMNDDDIPSINTTCNNHYTYLSLYSSNILCNTQNTCFLKNQALWEEVESHLSLCITASELTKFSCAELQNHITQLRISMFNIHELRSYLGNEDKILKTCYKNLASALDIRQILQVKKDTHAVLLSIHKKISAFSTLKRLQEIIQTLHDYSLSYTSKIQNMIQLQNPTPTSSHQQTHQHVILSQTCNAILKWGNSTKTPSKNITTHKTHPIPRTATAPDALLGNKNLLDILQNLTSDDLLKISLLSQKSASLYRWAIHSIQHEIQPLAIKHQEVLPSLNAQHIKTLLQEDHDMFAELPAKLRILSECVNNYNTLKDFLHIAEEPSQKHYDHFKDHTSMHPIHSQILCWLMNCYMDVLNHDNLQEILFTSTSNKYKNLTSYLSCIQELSKMYCSHSEESCNTITLEQIHAICNIIASHDLTNTPYDMNPIVTVVSNIFEEIQDLSTYLSTFLNVYNDLSNHLHIIILPKEIEDTILSLNTLMTSQDSSNTNISYKAKKIADCIPYLQVLQSNIDTVNTIQTEIKKLDSFIEPSLLQALHQTRDKIQNSKQPYLLCNTLPSLYQKISTISEDYDNEEFFDAEEVLDSSLPVSDTDKKNTSPEVVDQSHVHDIINTAEYEAQIIRFIHTHLSCALPEDPSNFPVEGMKIAIPLAKIQSSLVYDISSYHHLHAPRIDTPAPISQDMTPEIPETVDITRCINYFMTTHSAQLLHPWKCTYNPVLQKIKSLVQQHTKHILLQRLNIYKQIEHLTSRPNNTQSTYDKSQTLLTQWATNISTNQSPNNDIANIYYYIFIHLLYNSHISNQRDSDDQLHVHLLPALNDVGALFINPEIRAKNFSCDENKKIICHNELSLHKICNLKHTLQLILPSLNSLSYPTFTNTTTAQPIVQVIQILDNLLSTIITSSKAYKAQQTPRLDTSTPSDILSPASTTTTQATPTASTTTTQTTPTASTTNPDISVVHTSSSTSSSTDTQTSSSNNTATLTPVNNVHHSSNTKNTVLIKKDTDTTIQLSNMWIQLYTQLCSKRETLHELSQALLANDKDCLSYPHIKTWIANVEQLLIMHENIINLLETHIITQQDYFKKLDNPSFSDIAKRTITEEYIKKLQFFYTTYNKEHKKYNTMCNAISLQYLLPRTKHIRSTVSYYLTTQGENSLVNKINTLQKICTTPLETLSLTLDAQTYQTQYKIFIQQDTVFQELQSTYSVSSGTKMKSITVSPCSCKSITHTIEIPCDTSSTYTINDLIAGLLTYTSHTVDPNIWSKNNEMSTLKQLCELLSSINNSTATAYEQNFYTYTHILEYLLKDDKCMLKILQNFIKDTGTVQITKTIAQDMISTSNHIITTLHQQYTALHSTILNNNLSISPVFNLDTILTTINLLQEKQRKISTTISNLKSPEAIYDDKIISELSTIYKQCLISQEAIKNVMTHLTKNVKDQSNNKSSHDTTIPQKIALVMKAGLTIVPTPIQCIDTTHETELLNKYETHISTNDLDTALIQLSLQKKHASLKTPDISQYPIIKIKDIDFNTQTYDIRAVGHINKNPKYNLQHPVSSEILDRSDSILLAPCGPKVAMPGTEPKQYVCSVGVYTVNRNADSDPKYKFFTKCGTLYSNDIPVMCSLSAKDLQDNDVPTATEEYKFGNSTISAIATQNKDHPDAKKFQAYALSYRKQSIKNDIHTHTQCIYQQSTPISQEQSITHIITDTTPYVMWAQNSMHANAIPDSSGLASNNSKLQVILSQAKECIKAPDVSNNTILRMIESIKHSGYQNSTLNNTATRIIKELQERLRNDVENQKEDISQKNDELSETITSLYDDSDPQQSQKKTVNDLDSKKDHDKFSYNYDEDTKKDITSKVSSSVTISVPSDDTAQAPSLISKATWSNMSPQDKTITKVATGTTIVSGTATATGVGGTILTATTNIGGATLGPMLGCGIFAFIAIVVLFCSAGIIYKKLRNSKQDIKDNMISTHSPIIPISQPSSLPADPDDTENDKTTEPSEHSSTSISEPLIHETHTYHNKNTIT